MLRKWLVLCLSGLMLLSLPYDAEARRRGGGSRRKIGGSSGTRRSPRRHYVSGYTRKDGTRVSGYMRGSGSGSSYVRSSSRRRSYGSGYSSGGYRRRSNGYTTERSDSDMTMTQNYQVVADTPTTVASAAALSDGSGGPMPGTGGSPLTMILGGSSLTLGAFMLRRRLK